MGVLEQALYAIKAETRLVYPSVYSFWTSIYQVLTTACRS